MKVRVIWKPGGMRNRSAGAELEAPPQALVDTCAHILWGVDDGPGGLDQSIAMLKVAVEHGTTDIVAASRASLEYPFNPEVIAQRIDEIRARCDGSIRIHTGCTLHFGLGNIRDALANPHKYAINGQTHLLVEFSDVVLPPATEEILRKFRAKGVVPVISHPERNPVLQRSPERLQAWISMGCVLQVTARSLSGHFGPIEQRFAWDLLGAGMVHAIASDAHDALHRPPRLDAAWRRIKHELGEITAKKLLIDNPSAMIQGGEEVLGREPAVSAAVDRTQARERTRTVPVPW
jgi:protein-tyrosine phosphatase